MKKIILFFLLFGFAISAFSQQDFQFKNTKSNKIRVPVKIINNLVFIPVKVNGVELLFLLDSGVEETILFGLEDTKELNLNRVEKINIRGLGSNEAVEGLKSGGNLLEIDKLQSENHMLYLVLDPLFNLSAFVGITVNGIIGSSAFKNHLVETDYRNKVVFFYKTDSKYHHKIEKKYSKIPIFIEKNKPYVNSSVWMDRDEVKAKLLIDSGNSDAVWLFDQLSYKIDVPQNNFYDYLGQGLSGTVEGRRARVVKFSIGDFQFDFPVVAFPDAASIKNISLQSNRLGSLGGAILKRFSVVFDYKNSWLYLKKNKSYKAPFYYNKSGIEIWYTSLQLVPQMVISMNNSIVISGEANKSANKYRLELKPVYEIGYVREQSGAFESGLKKGDLLVAIDGKPAYNFSLSEINSLLWSEEEIWIELSIQRDGKLMDFRFRLLNVL
ncbi:aspartyl protease family protein [Flavobacterium sp. ST-87]|uniref:Aspartyl protease family protein n=1 Tax=Flavobacterium plantiphilum TaxID=3163297 RepID=A0ABW8XVT0_9FLAO